MTVLGGVIGSRKDRVGIEKSLGPTVKLIGCHYFLYSSAFVGCPTGNPFS